MNLLFNTLSVIAWGVLLLGTVLMIFNMVRYK